MSVTFGKSVTITIKPQPPMFEWMIGKRIKLGGNIVSKQLAKNKKMIGRMVKKDLDPSVIVTGVTHDDSSHTITTKPFF